MRKKYFKRGLTLIETLVSLGLIIFVTASFINGLIGFLKLNKQNNELFIADQLIMAQVEKYKSIGAPDNGTYEIDPQLILPTNEQAVKNLYQNIKINVVSSSSDIDVNLKKIQIIAYKVDKNNKIASNGDGISQVLDQYVIYLKK